jgi:hypothetical protein
MSIPLIPYAESAHNPFVNLNAQLHKCPHFTDRFPTSAEPQAPHPGQYALNQKRVTEWIRMHPEEHRDLAQRVAIHMNYISYAQWCSALKESCAEFEKALKGKEYVLALQKHEGKKSSAWVAQHVLIYLSRKPLYVASIEQLAINKLYTTTLYVDDATYTGSQLSMAFLRLDKMLYKAHIYVIVPYATNCVVKAIEGYKKDNITLLSSRNLPTLEEHFSEDELLKIVSTYYKGMTSTIFQHKCPDAKSTISSIFLGRSLRIACDFKSKEHKPLLDLVDLPPPYIRKEHLEPTI